MNNQTRYCIVLYGLKAEHFKKLGSIVLSAIEETFIAEGFPVDWVKRYIENCGDVVYTKTHDRSILSQMNDFLIYVSWEIEDHLPTNTVNMVELNKRVGRQLCGTLGYVHPIEMLTKAMEEMGPGVRWMKAYQIKIELFDSEPLIWRRVIIPADVTFRRLHDTIQLSMGWRDYHLYEFGFPQEKLRITNDEESYGEFKFFSAKYQGKKPAGKEDPHGFIARILDTNILGSRKLLRLISIWRNISPLIMSTILETIGSTESN